MLLYQGLSGMDNIVFLDVDGTMIPNNSEFMQCFNHEAGSYVYCPLITQRLIQFCKDYNCKIVYNSSHCDQGPFNMMKQATHNGLKNFLHHTYWTTGYPIAYVNRLDAVYAWIGHNTDKFNFVILDDWKLKDRRAVKLDPIVGITDRDLIKAAKILGFK